MSSVRDTFAERFEASRILYRHGEKQEAKALLRHLWEAPYRKPIHEFRVFCALMEVWCFENPRAVLGFLESLILGEGDLQAFWARRSLAEQACLFEWHGQLAFATGDDFLALESLARAASLGRDTSLLWRLLATLHANHGELDLAVRYCRRSLNLFKQLELDILGTHADALGWFSGEHPLRFESGVEPYMKILLLVTRLAKSHRNLRAVRELLVELIHCFPDEGRLHRIRLMLERSIVESSLTSTAIEAPR